MCLHIHDNSGLTEEERDNLRRSRRRLGCNGSSIDNMVSLFYDHRMPFMHAGFEICDSLSHVKYCVHDTSLPSFHPCKYTFSSPKSGRDILFSGHSRSPSTLRACINVVRSVFNRDGIPKHGDKNLCPPHIAIFHVFSISIPSALSQISSDRWPI